MLIALGWLAAALVIAFEWWYLRVELPNQNRVAGCRHTRGRLIEAAPNQFGVCTALVWLCDECPFQAPLPKVHRWIYDHPQGTLWVFEDGKTRAKS